MRIFFTIVFATILLVFELSSFAQNKFSNFNDTNIFFISNQQIIENNINYIYTITKLQSDGNMNQQIDFSIIDFSELKNSITDNWHVFYSEDDTITPDIEHLNENSLLLNGLFWSFENGKLLSKGSQGYGTHCYYEYEYFEQSAIITEYCRGSSFSNYRMAKFLENGLTDFIICCLTDSIYNENEHDVEQIKILFETQTQFFDTTSIAYDDKGIAIEIRDNSNIYNLRNLVEKKIEFESYYPFNNESQLYIDNEKFEEWIEENLKIKPKVILFEISEFAVFVFIYNKEKGKYFQYQNFEIL